MRPSTSGNSYKLLSGGCLFILRASVCSSELSLVVAVLKGARETQEEDRVVATHRGWGRHGSSPLHGARVSKGAE